MKVCPPPTHPHAPRQTTHRCLMPSYTTSVGRWHVCFIHQGASQASNHPPTHPPIPQSKMEEAARAARAQQQPPTPTPPPAGEGLPEDSAILAEATKYVLHG